MKNDYQVTSRMITKVLGDTDDVHAFLLENKIPKFIMTTGQTLRHRARLYDTGLRNGLHIVP